MGGIHGWDPFHPNYLTLTLLKQLQTKTSYFDYFWTVLHSIRSPFNQFFRLIQFLILFKAPIPCITHYLLCQLSDYKDSENQTQVLILYIKCSSRRRIFGGLLFIKGG